MTFSSGALLYSLLHRQLSRLDTCWEYFPVEDTVQVPIQKGFYFLFCIHISQVLVLSVLIFRIIRLLLHFS